MPGEGQDAPSYRAGGDEVAMRRRAVVMSGHEGRPEVARQALRDPAATVRAAALGALGRTGSLNPEDLACALDDPAPVVRRRAAQLAPGILADQGVDAELMAHLVRAMGQEDSSVCEAVCHALGEVPAEMVGTDVVAALVGVARGRPEPLCREAAVAALGSLGKPEGLPAVLEAMADKPAVRRRAAVALAAFEGPEVEEALQRASTDKDWQVRQVAEDLLGARARPPG